MNAKPTSARFNKKTETRKKIEKKTKKNETKIFLIIIDSQALINLEKTKQTKQKRNLISTNRL